VVLKRSEISFRDRGEAQKETDHAVVREMPGSAENLLRGQPRMLLTGGDVERIFQATGTYDFVELKQYSDLSFLSAYEYDTNWRRYIVLPGNCAGNCSSTPAINAFS